MTKEQANKLINVICTLLSAIAAIFCGSSCVSHLNV